MFHLQNVFGRTLDVLGDPVTMERTEPQAAQDQKIKGTLDDLPGRHGRQTTIEPKAFKIVAALDLSLMVPALAVGGMMLWRRRSWGYVIATIAAIQGALYLLVLSVNSAIAVRRGLVSAPGELQIWGPLTIFTTIAAILLLRSASSNERAK